MGRKNVEAGKLLPRKFWIEVVFCNIRDILLLCLHKHAKSEGNLTCFPGSKHFSLPCMCKHSSNRPCCTQQTQTTVYVVVDGKQGPKF